jgi:uncharacterized protein YkwD
MGSPADRFGRLAFRQSSRRQFLGRLLALPGALGFAALQVQVQERLLDGGVASGKNKNKKRKRKNRHRSRRPGSSSAAAYTPETEELAFLDLLNAYRSAHGAGRLSLQHQLGAAAEHHSQDMAEHNYTSHNLSNGDGPLKNIERFGYSNFTYWGEIIAAGFETADEAISALKTSPSHDEMMRKKQFNHCGIGRAHSADSQWGWYWTVTFGKK